MSDYGIDWYINNYNASLTSYREIASLMHQLKPNATSGIDVGCALGGLLEQLPESMVRRGIDIHPYTRLLKIKEREYTRLDLRDNGIINLSRYDVALCIETAEHLEKRYAAKLVNLICSCSDTVIFSAATPKQGGEDHLNEQLHEYWHELFRKHGYNYTFIGDKLSNSVASYYRNNMFVYEKLFTKVSSKQDTAQF